MARFSHNSVTPKQRQAINDGHYGRRIQMLYDLFLGEMKILLFGTLLAYL